MIVDLDDATGVPFGATRHDVAVIGAGIAGLLLATELAARGLRCVVLESGGRSQDGETHPLNEVIQLRERYQGAAHGRFRCLGGTSTRWGGAMLPFLPEDLAPAHSAGWAVDWAGLRLDDLLPGLSTIERHFGLPPGPYDQEPEGSDAADFILRSPKWPAFARRNVARVFDAALRSPALQVWLHAHVVGIEVDEAGKARGVRVARSDGRSFELAADEVVVAAGAIESTRLLLQLDADRDRRLFEPQGVIGRHFHDHLSAPVADLSVRQPRAFARLTGFRFEAGGAMRNNRFELAGAARRALRLPAAFAHIGFATDGRSGFDGLREVYRALQQRRSPAAADLRLVAANGGWFARAAWSRLVQRRVLAPDGALHQLHLVTEQEPLASHRIGLADEARDRFGRPLASIAWGVTEADVAHADAACGALVRHWNAAGLDALAELRLHPASARAAALREGGGIYHPGGTLRIGRSPAGGVVDDRLRCFAVPNLRVLSTAAFPSGGGANPTLMLMLFALRLADELASAHARSAPQATRAAQESAA